MFGCGLVSINFTHILWSYFTGTGAIMIAPYSANEIVSKWLSLMAFLGRRGPCSPCNRNIHIGIIIFPHIDDTQSTGYNHFKMK